MFKEKKEVSLCAEVEVTQEELGLILQYLKELRALKKKMEEGHQ